MIRVEVGRLVGGSFAAWVAEPAGEGPSPGVVVLPDAGGVAPARAAAEALAAAGFLALVVEPGGAGAADGGGAVGASDPEAVLDVDAGIGWLRAHPRGSGRAGVLGFGAGGRLALILATSPAAPDAAVACDAVGVTRRTAVVDAGHPQVPLDRSPWLAAPLLWLSGTGAGDPSAADVEEVRAALAGAGAGHRVTVLPGASSDLPARLSGPAWEGTIAWLRAMEGEPRADRRSRV